ncbi:MAG: DNA integrity scanning protein DisA nucleotide-binding domain protein [Clostridia bacterium]|nr:DNA integrity scanning protein DisA nucleotide-binding domain protein [Clostridia bacterium]
MISAYTFTARSIVDLIAVVALMGIVLGFFMHKKSLKLTAIYALITIFFVAMVVLDELFYIPIARAVAEVVVLLMVVVVAVVYQSDFKVAFFNLTKNYDKNAIIDNDLSDEELRKAVDEIIRACQSMSKTRTGALIVIAPTSIATHVLETGVPLEALVSSALLEAIFNTQAQFHDGAVIVKGNKVLAAGCFLPLSQSQTVAKNLGTRHRAGIGITEETDMLTIIVSEETGIISIAKHGELRRFVTPDRLRDILHETLKISPQTRSRSLK